MEFRYEVLIRESHLDTFGHVNNATYLQLFEEARWELATSRGYGLREVQERRQGPVMLDVQIKFRRELSLRETITIVTRCESFVSRLGKVFQSMVKSDGTVACEAVSTFGFFDLNARKLIAPTPEWLHAAGIDEQAAKPAGPVVS